MKARRTASICPGSDAIAWRQRVSSLGIAPPPFGEAVLPSVPPSSSSSSESAAGAAGERRARPPPKSGRGDGSGERSNSAATSSAPETPSMIEWCTLVTRATRPCSRPSTTWNSQRGRRRSSGLDATSATNAASSSRPPGFGTAARRTWKSRSKLGSSTHEGWSTPKGTSDNRIRNAGTRSILSARTLRIRRNVTPPRERSVSKTSAATMWRWVVGDSNEEKKASSPLSRSTIYRPVDPKPSRPRSLGGNSSTSVKLASSTRSITSCAIRSPRRTS